LNLVKDRYALNRCCISLTCESGAVILKLQPPHTNWSTWICLS